VLPPRKRSVDQLDTLLMELGKGRTDLAMRHRLVALADPASSELKFACGLGVRSEGLVRVTDRDL
jgi:hypothetical protein